MKQSKCPPLDFEIDKLTNSIENTSTGEVFDTVVVRLTMKDLPLISKTQWTFDWRKEIKDKTKEVYKLSTVNNPKIIQLIKEPKNVDFTVQSMPWTEDELADFRKLMKGIKAKNSKKKIRHSNSKQKVGV